MYNCLDEVLHLPKLPHLFDPRSSDRSAFEFHPELGVRHLEARHSRSKRGFGHENRQLTALCRKLTSFAVSCRMIENRVQRRKRLGSGVDADKQTAFAVGVQFRRRGVSRGIFVHRVLHLAELENGVGQEAKGSQRVAAQGCILSEHLADPRYHSLLVGKNGGGNTQVCNLAIGNGAVCVSTLIKNKT